MRVTIKDISRYSGVSTSTVSRVLTNNPKVSPEALRKVQEAIDALGYIPNSAARSLVNKKRGMIGLIVPELENPYYTEIIHGVEEAASSHGFGTALSCHMDSAVDKSSIFKLMELGVDGIIHAGPLQDDQLIEYLRSQHIPHVLLGRKLESTSCSYVICSDYQSAFRGTSYLIDLGHRDIVFLFGKQSSYSSAQKYQGYLGALEAAGIQPRDSLFCSGGLSFQGGYEALKRLLEQKTGFSAVIAGNDMMALGAREALLEAGLRIPEDISLMGIDDIFWSRIKGIELTTVHVPQYEMGSKSFEILLGRIENPQAEEECCTLDGVLIERSSCRRKSNIA